MVNFNLPLLRLGVKHYHTPCPIVKEHTVVFAVEMARSGVTREPWVEAPVQQPTSQSKQLSTAKKAYDNAAHCFVGQAALSKAVPNGVT